jgi:hypothetical protein
MVGRDLALTSDSGEIVTRDIGQAARSRWTELRVAAKRRSSQHLPPLPAVNADERLHVNCIVFSKDRAMQLDACLRSIERFSGYRGDIIVIFKATSRGFEDGYQLLSGTTSARLFSQRRDLKVEVLDAIDPSRRCTVFHTDDDVFFRQPPGFAVPASGFAAFSQRLGKNTTYCHPLDRLQPLPSFEERDALLAWNWTRAKHDFAYPMSLDGHVFPTDLVRPLIERVQFDNPNEFEDALHAQRHRMPAAMLAFRESCLVSIPANVVTSTHRNRSTNRADWSPAVLNRRFLAGERIDLDAMEFLRVNGAHCDIPLRFTALPAGSRRLHDAPDVKQGERSVPAAGCEAAQYDQ